MLLLAAVLMVLTSAGFQVTTQWNDDVTHIVSETEPKATAAHVLALKKNATFISPRW